MESVFSTLEQTERMLKATRENKDFNLDEIREKKNRLLQAIAATLEESLCEPDERRYLGKKCVYHEEIVRAAKASDEIISFNYDCLVDETLKRCGDNKWNPRYGYGIKLGSRGAKLSGDEHWNPSAPSTKDRTIKLYKLHGSLHFDVRKNDRVALKQRPYTKQNGNLKFTIIPPESNKRYDEGIFLDLWKGASIALHRTRTLAIIGYSFPPTDSHANALFRVSTKEESLKNLVIVNPDRNARYRAREVLRRSLSSKTRILVFDNLKEFASVPRRLWDT